MTNTLPEKVGVWAAGMGECYWPARHAAAVVGLNGYEAPFLRYTCSACEQPDRVDTRTELLSVFFIAETWHAYCPECFLRKPM